MVEMPQKTRGRPITMSSWTGCSIPLTPIHLLPSWLSAICSHSHCCPWFQLPSALWEVPDPTPSPDLLISRLACKTRPCGSSTDLWLYVVQSQSHPPLTDTVILHPSKRASFWFPQYSPEPHIRLSSAHACHVLMFLSLWTLLPLCQGHFFHYFYI